MATFLVVCPPKFCMYSFELHVQSIVTMIGEVPRPVIFSVLHLFHSSSVQMLIFAFGINLIFHVNLCLLNDAFSTPRVESDDELKTTCKKRVVAKSKELLLHLPGGTEENKHAEPVPGRRSEYSLHRDL